MDRLLLVNPIHLLKTQLIRLLCCYQTSPIRTVQVFIGLPNNPKQISSHDSTLYISLITRGSTAPLSPEAPPLLGNYCRISDHLRRSSGEHCQNSGHLQSLLPISLLYHHRSLLPISHTARAPVISLHMTCLYHCYFDQNIY